MPDEFTRQFLGDSPKNGSIEEPLVSAAGFSGFNLHQEAAPISLPSSGVTVLQDSISGGERFLSIRLDPLRRIDRIDVRLTEGTRVGDLRVQGEPALHSGGEEFLVGREDSRHLFRYHFSDSGEALHFTYSIPKGDDPSLLLTEVSYDLLHHPEIRRIKPDLHQRPANLMEKPFIVNDAIINLRELRFQ
jgi:hypothetical protein